MYCMNVSKMKKNDYKRVLRYEIQGRKYQRIIKGLDCNQWYHIMGSRRVGVWGFVFYLRTKKGIVNFKDRRLCHWFKPCCTSEFFCDHHISEF